MRKLSALVCTVALVASTVAWAMPTAKELDKVRDDIADLTRGRDAAGVAELVAKAETEASRYLLLRKAAELHVAEKKYDAAAADLEALYAVVQDIPPAAVVSEVKGVARGLNEKDAPRLLELLRKSQALGRELKAKKPNAQALAELRASVGQWNVALEIFAKLGGDFAKVVENETEQVDIPAAAEFWWKYKPTVVIAGDAFKAHAAQLYQSCIDGGLVKNQLKIELMKTRIAEIESRGVAPQPVVVPSASGSSAGKLYMVVDLAHGPKARKYPVTYLKDVPKGGWTKEHKTKKLVLRRIEPGTFQMGESGKSVEVTITKPFYMGVFEVTQKQYEFVMGTNPAQAKGDMRPVEAVSWNMIRGVSAVHDWPTKKTVADDSFVGRIRARAGLEFDLPTEAQWEYTCRAGTTSTYNNGGDSEDDLKKLGRYRMNQSGRGWQEGDESLKKHIPDNAGGQAERHTVVGSYKPNAWGIYDMHGNVWEWCLDWKGGNLVGGSDPLGEASGSCRVMRGGSWNYNAYYCRSADRGYGSPSYVNYNGGFRLCCSAGSSNQ